MIPFDIASFQEDSLSNLRTPFLGISQLMVECTCWWVTPCIRKEHASHFTAAVSYVEK